MIFPITDAQSNGIEDTRFVEFNDDGKTTLCATYTAYSGRAIRSELLDKGFPSLSISEVKGSGRQKGLVEAYRGSSLTVSV